MYQTDELKELLLSNFASIFQAVIYNSYIPFQTVIFTLSLNVTGNEEPGIFVPLPECHTKFTTGDPYLNPSSDCVTA